MSENTSRQRVNSEHPNTGDTSTTSDSCHKTPTYWQPIISTRMSNVRKPTAADDEKTNMGITCNTALRHKETALGAVTPAIGSKTVRSQIRGSREKFSAVSVS